MKLSILFALGALAAGGAAFAQDQGGGPTPEMAAARQAVMAACAADLKTLCGGKQGRDAMMCMRDNAAKVSTGCKDAMSKMPRRGPPAG
jgi:hypothetical protein